MSRYYLNETDGSYRTAWLNLVREVNGSVFGKNILDPKYGEIALAGTPEFKTLIYILFSSLLEPYHGKPMTEPGDGECIEFENDEQLVAFLLRWA